MDIVKLDALLRESLATPESSRAELVTVRRWLETARATNHDWPTIRERIVEAARLRQSTEPTAPVFAWLTQALATLEPRGPLLEPSRASFSPGSTCLTRIISRFQSARKQVDVCVFTITDNRITQAILAAHGRGVQLRVITDNDKSTDLGSDIAELHAAGVAIAVDRTAYHMHHKFALFDDSWLINGSYNWTRGAAEQNQENLIETSERAVLGAFQTEFNRLWQQFSGPSESQPRG